MSLNTEEAAAAAAAPPPSAAPSDPASLDNQPWTRMEMSTFQKLRNGTTFAVDKVAKRIFGDTPLEDQVRVLWLSGTLFFIVGGYWLLRSLKDPIISTIVGVDRIPQAKMCSLVVVLALVVVYNKLVDMVPKHQLFYIIGGFYAVVFTIIAMLLSHPTIGIQNTNPDPSRVIGWVSYFAIESFGSIVVQLFWAFVNASVDLNFAKKNYGLIVAGAQIGSILGPTAATAAPVLGVPTLYFCGAFCMAMMVGMVFLYVQKFGVLVETAQPEKSEKEKKKSGVLEGFYLFWEHDYIKGIFALSCMFMIAVTILDYTMKFLAKSKFDAMYPDDNDMAVRAFAQFMGWFGQVTNGISFCFSLFGTGAVIKYLGLEKTLLLFPSLVLGCVLVVYTFRDIWVVFFVMMVIKGMSYALNNPCKELLYQPTASSVKFKCKSWIDTFGARGSKALGSVVTNAYANSMEQLFAYGTVVSVCVCAFLIYVATFMGRKFNEYTASGVKVGENNVYINLAELGAAQTATDDTSCGVEEEGQAEPSLQTETPSVAKV